MSEPMIVPDGMIKTMINFYLIAFLFSCKPELFTAYQTPPNQKITELQQISAGVVCARRT